MTEEQQSNISENIQSAPAFLGPIDLLKDTWEIYKQRIKIFAGIMLVPALIMNFYIPVTYSAFNFFGLLILFAIAAFIITFWSYVALLYAIKDSGENIGFKESFHRGWRRLASFIWIGFLVGIIVFGGTLLFIIPGIIFFIWFAFAEFILINEEKRGMNALWQSKEYVKGRWFGVFWRIVVILLFHIILTLIVNLIISAIHIPLADQVSSSILTIFLTPFTVAYYFLLYNNLKTLKSHN